MGKSPQLDKRLIDYCLRVLGDPVLEVNVDQLIQIEDRIDEALQFWQAFHSEATYRTYVSQLIGDSDVTNEYIDVGVGCFIYKSII